MHLSIANRNYVQTHVSEQKTRATNVTNEPCYFSAKSTARPYRPRISHILGRYTACTLWMYNRDRYTSRSPVKTQKRPAQVQLRGMPTKRLAAKLFVTMYWFCTSHCIFFPSIAQKSWHYLRLSAAAALSVWFARGLKPRSLV